MSTIYHNILRIFQDQCNSLNNRLKDKYFLTDIIEQSSVNLYYKIITSLQLNKIPFSTDLLVS